MAQILSGKELAEKLTLELINRITKLGTEPKLVIIQVGDLEESNRYIKRKIDFADKIGAEVLHKKYSEDVSELEIITDIDKFNNDTDVHGIIVQLPIPKNLNAGEILKAVNREKDVDGLTPENIKKLFDEEEAIIPATTRGIMTLLENYGISLEGKRVTLVGESSLVGRPTLLALLNRKATVTVCHTHTKNLAEETKRAEILIVATGASKLITLDFVCPGQVIVDVGISLDETLKVSGDVDFEKVKDIVGAISPVPGGVGPMTVFSLFQNLVDACENQKPK